MGQRWLAAGDPHEAFPSLDLGFCGAPAVSFTTRTENPAHQFEAYRAWMAPLAALHRADGRGPRERFAADQTIWNVGGLTLLHETCDAVAGDVRGARGTCANDHWVLGLHIKGNTEARSGDAIRRSPAGALAFASLANASRLRQTRSETLYLLVPRDRLSHLAGRLDRRHNTNLEGSAARLLADHIMSLGRNLAWLDDPGRTAAARALLALIEGCLESDQAAELSEAALLGDRLWRRALSFVRSHLSEPLDPATLCAQLEVSRSQLYRAFENEGGVSSAIRRERLEAARAALAHPDDERSVSEIARACGFLSSAEFSRAFRRAYGCRPSDVHRVGP